MGSSRSAPAITARLRGTPATPAGWSAASRSRCCSMRRSAQLRGDREAAERSFAAMAKHDQTRLLGLRGLFIEAQRKGDVAAARRYAEHALDAAPALPWAARAVLEFRCAAGDWAGALARARAQSAGRPRR